MKLDGIGKSFLAKIVAIGARPESAPEEPQPQELYSPGSPGKSAPPVPAPTGSPPPFPAGPTPSAIPQTLQGVEDQVVPAKPGRTFAEIMREANRDVKDRVLSAVGQGDPVVGLRAELNHINRLEAMAQKLVTPADFAAKTAEFKRRLADGESLESIRPEAYAVAREACLRALPEPRPGVKMRPFDVQMLGALAMDQGRIAEMRTGEGKTLTAVMPAYLNALAGKGVHLVTANEPLAKRDANSMRPAFEVLGMNVATVLESMTSDEKRAAYNADVTYLTNSTLGFDYLRDRTCRDASLRVQREPFFALVDEVDEVLVDEARVPLIVSQSAPAGENHYKEFADLVAPMVAGDDFQTDMEKHAAFLTETGQDWVSNQLGMTRAQRHLSYAKQAVQEAEQKRAASPDEGTRLKAERRLARADKLSQAAQRQLDKGAEVNRAIRQEQKLERELNAPPAEDSELSAKEQREVKNTALEVARQVKQELQKEFPGFNLYHTAHDHKVCYLNKAVEARGLFRLGKDYTIALPEKQEAELADLCRTLQVTPSESNHSKLLLAAALQEMGNLGDPGQDLGAAIREGAGQSKVSEYLDGLVAREAQRLNLEPGQLLTQIYKTQAEVKIVDEFKGRIADGRRFNDGLHEALEAKEGLLSKEEQRSVASITYPNLFRRYPRLAGMSGTAKSAEKEFRELYNLEVAVIPTNKETRLIREPDAVYRTFQEKCEAMVAEAKRCYEEGIPVLVGTRSVEVNLKLVDMLQKAGVPCQCLNAESVKNNTDKENAMLAKAGQSGWVTVATNMAGRGVDIKEDQTSYKKLSLVASQLAHPNLVALYHQDMRNPEQAEQWNQFLQEASLDPACFAARMAGAQATGQKSLPVVVEVDSLGEAERLGQWFNSPAERGESPVPFEIGGSLRPGIIQIRVRSDEPLPEGALCLKQDDFPTGGLRVLGSERHTSKRIDDQLTGRAARQGRPGSARFYISLEDELLRIYGADSVGKMLKDAGEGGISDAKLDRLISQCQDKVEDANYDARLSTTKFDGAMNQHRQLFYELRESIVNSKPGSPDTATTIDLGQTVIDWTTDALVRATKLEFPENVGREPGLEAGDLDRHTQARHKPEQVRDAIEAAAQKMGLPIRVKLDSSFLKLGGGIGDIMIDPGRKVETKELQELIGNVVERLTRQVEGGLIAGDGFTPEQLDKLHWDTMLDAMDGAWTNHLDNMDSLKQTAQLQSYAEKEPIQVYQGLAFNAFEKTVAAYQDETARKVLPGLLKTAELMQKIQASVPSAPNL